MLHCPRSSLYNTPNTRDTRFPKSSGWPYSMRLSVDMVGLAA